MRLFKALAYFGFFSVTVSSVMIAQTPTWSHLVPTGTGPMLNSNPAVYDATSNTLIFFGGLSADGLCCTSDTWILTNANGVSGNPTWQKLAPIGALPPSRVSHSAVYDSDNNRLIIFAGGVLSNQCFAFCVLYNDVWVLSNANGKGGVPGWTQLAPAGAMPAVRSAQAAVYDSTTNRMVIFGGGDDGINDLNDTWVLTNANGIGSSPEWIQLSPSEGPPSPREVAMVSYDPVANVMTIFGGSFQSDLWTLSNANGAGSSTPTWQQMTQTSPSPGTLSNWNYGHDEAANMMIFFGGSPSFGTFRNDVWELHNANGTGTPTWQQLIPNGEPGSPPAGAFIGSYDPTLKRLMITPDAADLWVLPLSEYTNAGFLDFPLPNRTAKTAKIVSVFDHSSSWQYCADGTVIAYDGEEGSLQRDHEPTRPFCSWTGEFNALYAFSQPYWHPFSVNGQYVGLKGDGGAEFLQYDGHPGFDFVTTDQKPDGKIPVFAAADGKVVCSNVPTSCRDSNTVDPCIEGPGEIKIKHANGYFSIYLHLSSSFVVAKETVLSGQQIGISGATGTPQCSSPHLHFEIRKEGPSCNPHGVCTCNRSETENEKNCIPVDPYGWTGASGADPYKHGNSAVQNIELWK